MVLQTTGVDINTAPGDLTRTPGIVVDPNPGATAVSRGFPHPWFLTTAQFEALKWLLKGERCNRAVKTRQALMKVSHVETRGQWRDRGL